MCQLIFDGDYNPKGLAINLKHGDVFSNISHITFDSNPSKTINLKGLQFGLSKSINDFTDAKISFAVYDFDEIRGSAPNEVTWNGKHFGNSLDGNGRYLYDFSVRNLSAEVKTKVMAMPVTLFLDVINNSDADENDKGFQSGFNLLINQKWTFKYLYKDIESDATFDALVDSNLGGGGTGHKGHQFNLSYPMTERFSVDVVWFDNKKKMITDYNKIFVDFKYKL